MNQSDPRNSQPAPAAAGDSQGHHPRARRQGNPACADNWRSCPKRRNARRRALTCPRVRSSSASGARIAHDFKPLPERSTGAGVNSRSRRTHSGSELDETRGGGEQQPARRHQPDHLLFEPLERSLRGVTKRAGDSQSDTCALHPFVSHPGSGRRYLCSNYSSRSTMTEQCESAWRGHSNRLGRYQRPCAGPVRRSTSSPAIVAMAYVPTIAGPHGRSSRARALTWATLNLGQLIGQSRQLAPGEAWAHFRVRPGKLPSSPSPFSRRPPASPEVPRGQTV